MDNSKKENLHSEDYQKYFKSFDNQKDVLSQIEKYLGPAYPTTAYEDCETYDYRIRLKKTIPPTLTDVLIYDILQKVKTRFENIKIEDIQEVLSIYKEVNWMELSGLRPYTHANFINSLDDSELNILSHNIVDYIQEDGFKRMIL